MIMYKIIKCDYNKETKTDKPIGSLAVMQKEFEENITDLLKFYVDMNNQKENK